MTTNNSIQWHLKCHTCGTTFSQEDAPLYLCPLCARTNVDNAALKGVCLCFYDYAEWAHSHTRESAWDSILFPHFPFPKEALPAVGKTPLYNAPRLAHILHLSNVAVKNETVEPTGSLKDRASWLVVRAALHYDSSTLTCASTGNAAGSLAGMCAAANLTCHLFVSAHAPKAKIVQPAATGAVIHRIDGSYDECFSLSCRATEKYGWYNRNTAYNPWTIEGKKSVAWEIACQYDFSLPDYIFVPTGDGVIISAIHKGFYDLVQLGWLSHIPRLVAVQPEGSSAIHSAIKNNSDGSSAYTRNARSIADSLVVDAPRNAIMACDAIRSSRGFTIAVSDDDIRAAISIIGKNTGIFVEPAGAAAFAGAKKARDNNLINENNTILLLLTGSGMKDIESAEDAVHISPAVSPENAFVN